MDWKGFTHDLLRIAAGLMFLPHGAQKLFGLWGRDPAILASQSGVGGVIELFGGLLLVVGAVHALDRVSLLGNDGSRILAISRCGLLG
ncbi:MAG: hypothetical protein R2724_02740 [Bryobacterales bacterium]